MSTLSVPGVSCQTSSSSLVDISSVTGPPAARPALPLSVTVSSPLSLRTRRIRPVRRRRRMMTPVDKKDTNYWDKRRKNNEAARRSRERRRLNDLMKEGQLLALNEENAQLRAHVLSLQYHTSVSAGRGKAASPMGATFPSSVVAPTYSLSPRNPAYSRAGHWVSSDDATASILSVRHQENRPCDVRCFGTTEADGAFKGASSSSLQGLRSAEAQTGPQRRFAFSDDNFTQNYYIRTFLHGAADAPRHASTHKPHSWFESQRSSSAVYNNLLLPWWSSYTPPPTSLYSILPPYRLSCAGPGLHLSADGR